MIPKPLGRQEPRKRYCTTQGFISQGLCTLHTSLFCLWPAVGLCVRSLTPLSLRVLVCKMGIATVPLWSWPWP